MAYQFHEIDLFVFDVHLTLKAFQTPALLQRNFAFLVDPTMYSSQYHAAPFDTANFTVRPMTRRARKRMHFWRYYGSSSVTASNDAWGLQMPFVCRPKAALTLAATTASFNVSLRPVIYLFPLGWSVNIEACLTGQIDENELIAFVGKLRSAGQRPLKFKQKDCSTSELFKALSQQLRHDAFVDPDTAEDVAVIPRHMLISLSQFSGPVQRYRTSYAQQSRMPDADRALMHSILLGEKIAIPDLVRNESGKKFMLTHFDKENFAITYFDIGTLLFMQNEARPADERRKSILCLAANLRSFSMSSRALLEFHSELAGPDPKISSMQETMKRRLFDVGKRYNNALCKTWYLNNKRLGAFANP